MLTQKKKNNIIEFYRILFTFVICIYHVGFENKYNIFTHGYACVEFFCILSGYLLYKTFERKGDKMGSIDYLAGRVKRLYPEYVFAAVVAIVFFGIVNPDFNPVMVITELLMVQNVGLFSGGYNTPTWYISAMLAASVIIYGLLSVNRNLFVKVIAPLSVLCGYVYIFKTAGGLESWIIAQFVSVMLLRVFCGLSLGVIVAVLAENKTVRKMNTCTAVLIETACLAFTVYGLITKNDYDSLLVFSFAGLVFSAVLQKGLLSMKPFEKISGIIGKIALISYAMYLNHRACRFGITMINRSFLHLGDEWIFIYLAALVVYSVITYNVINAIVRKLESRKKQ